MTAIKNTTFEKGTSGNPGGRPKGKGKPVSPLRKTLAKFRAIEDESVEIISRIIKAEKEGKDASPIDKQRLETAKWVISTITALSRAATSDENLRLEARERDDEGSTSVADGNKKSSEEESGKTGNVLKFSTKIIRDEDLDEE